MQAPQLELLQFITPSGLTGTQTAVKSVVLSNPDDPLSAVTETKTVTINGQATITVYDGVTREAVRTSPEGRQAKITLNLQDRFKERGIVGLTPTEFEYDSFGRLVIIRQGTRTRGISYDGSNIASITDRLSRVMSFERDAAGRVTKKIAPGGRVTDYSYDKDSNLTSLTPPGGQIHRFNYTDRGFLKDYIAPDLGIGAPPLQFEYNLDRQLTTVSRPDGASIVRGYDAVGRLGSVTLPRGSIIRSYDPNTGNLNALKAPDGGTLNYEFDGRLLTARIWDGEVAGEVRSTFDENFRIIARSVNGQTIDYLYDNDGLRIRSGDLAITHDAQHGLVTGTSLGSVATASSYNGFAEKETFTATFSGGEIFSEGYTYDAMGRIVQKVANIAGSEMTLGYMYDLADRLAEVTRDGISASVYTYDSNGNRLTHTGATGTVAGTYDVQDRLISYGDFAYTYNASGDLTRKTEASTGAVTAYDYDVLGNLMTVTLPDGTLIEYVIDGKNRRIGKKVNGILVQGLLYKDRLDPIAELDGAGNIVSRFVYGNRLNVPEYMIRNGTSYRIVSDQLGSPRLVIDVVTGAVMQRMDYDEFGTVISDSNPGFQPFGFAGGLYEPQTTLTRFGARDYDAEIGRWLTKEPILLYNDMENMYAYAGNSPVSFVDFTGASESDLSPSAQNAPAGSGDEVPKGYSETMEDSDGTKQTVGRNEDGTYFDQLENKSGTIKQEINTDLDEETGDFSQTTSFEDLEFASEELEAELDKMISDKLEPPEDDGDDGDKIDPKPDPDDDVDKPKKKQKKKQKKKKKKLDNCP